MGAKDWMLLYADSDIAKILRSEPQLDRAATQALVERLHPDTPLTPIADGSMDYTNPPDSEIYAGVFPGLAVVCTQEAALDRPSTLDQRFVDEARGRTLYLHASHSVIDWFGYAIWTGGGELTRAVSVRPDDGVIENLGEPLPFERPYWAGEKPLMYGEERIDYPLPFHPLELAQDALRALFGFVYEGRLHSDDPELDEIPLAAYRLG
jgi:hypothetical protein